MKRIKYLQEYFIRDIIDGQGGQQPWVSTTGMTWKISDGVTAKGLAHNTRLSSTWSSQ